MHSQPQESFFTTWQSREIYLWSQSVKKSLLIAATLSCSTRLVDHIFTSLTPSAIFVAVAIALLVSTMFTWMTDCKSEILIQISMHLFMNAIQAYLIALATVIFPENIGILSISSTLVFGLYEIQSFHERWVVILTYFRHFAMWFWAFSYVNGKSTGFPYMMAFMGATFVLLSTAEMRKRAIKAFTFLDSIKQQEEKMKAILQAIPEGLIVITEDFVVASYNNRLLENLNAASVDCVLSKMRKIHCSLCAESDAVADDSLMQQVTDFVSDSLSRFCTFGVSEIRGRHFEWKGTKCCWGEKHACIVTASDTSFWVNAQTLLKQESNSKTALLRFVSHELRTPANAILNLSSSVMEADNILPKQRTDLSIVVTSTHFLLSVVNDLLDYTRMIADKFALVKQSFDIRNSIEETVSLVELQCKQKGLSLKINVDVLTPKFIYSDATRLKQVVLNLLGNALKFTFKGGIKVICMMTDRNTVKIAVKDTGLGIPTDKIAGLCQAFGTVEGTQRINPQGCGLGLYISNLLALSLGSKPIEIHSKIGTGSEFSFEVDIFQERNHVEQTGMDSSVMNVEDERESEVLVTCSSLQGGNSLQSISFPSILIVDDSDFNRIVLSQMLGSLHLRCDEASSGLRAVSLIRESLRRGHHYRLILMDAEMPEMDGITATQEIRTMEITGELQERPKIICCTAHRGFEDIERCMAAGMDDYLEKPISKAKLQELVESL